MEKTLPTVLVQPGEADRILAGHPWLYAGSVLRLTQSAEDGELVQVKDHRQRFLGVGIYNSKSKIHVRMLAPQRVALDEAFFEERIRAALAVRKRHMPKATSFRVVNAESDFLSGLIIDKYEDVLVMQTSALGMDQRKERIVRVLQKIFSPRCIVEKNDSAYRKFEGLEDSNGILFGVLKGPVPIQLNGIAFEVDILGGHKTGMYLDQQANYQQVAELTKGAQVLDCFSFLGGFGLHAARAGAAHVHMLDQSADAIAAATKNAATNKLSANCSFETVNVFDWLKAQTAVAPHDIVRLGLVHSPEGRRVFPRMTVAENLEMGAYTRTDKPGILADFERVYELFPVLRERKLQPAGTLSGGEQQMLAVGRAMMTRPKLLLLDEPSLGLAPLIVARIFQVIQTLNQQGVTILLVEQNARMALKIAHRAYVLETGEVTMAGAAADVLADPRVAAAYLGE